MNSEDAGLVCSLSLNTEPPGDKDTVDDVETVFSIPYLEAGSHCVRLEHSSVLDLTEVGGGSVVGLTHTGHLTCYDPELLVSTWDLSPGQDTVRAVSSHTTHPNLMLTCKDPGRSWNQEHGLSKNIMYMTFMNFKMKNIFVLHNKL